MNPQNDEQTELLREIAKWIRFTGMNQVKAVLEQQLKTDADRLIYQMSDGKHGTVELGKLAGVSNATVHDRWESWEKTGLGENIPVSGGTRFKRSFDLADFGFSVPKTKDAIKDQCSKNETEEKGNA